MRPPSLNGALKFKAVIYFKSDRCYTYFLRYGLIDHMKFLFLILDKDDAFFTGYSSDQISKENKTGSYQSL